MLSNQNALKLAEILILTASLALIVVGVITAIQVRESEREHRRVAEQILADMKSILDGRAACVIPLEE